MTWIISFQPAREGGEPVSKLAIPRRMLGETLLQRGFVERRTLDGALARQKEYDAPLGRILVAEDALSEHLLLQALASQADLPLVNLRETPPEVDLLDGVDPYLCLQLEALPWRRTGSTLVLAVARPSEAEAAVAAFGDGAAKIALVLASAEDIRALLSSRFSNELRDGARERCPLEYSCRSLEAPGSRSRLFGVLGAMAALVALAPLLVLQILMVWVLLMNGLTSLLRLTALVARFRWGRQKIHADVPRLADFKRLPTVSLLVPLKGEASVAGGLIRALDHIDYPRALLDIKLVLEEEDLGTRAALDRMRLPRWYEIITVPSDRALQTKPRAMNFALPFCRGSIVGIYDAEDRPDPAQLRAVVQALADAPPQVACVQGFLDFYNPADNWLARCFTIEYAIWFRVLLHGVQRLGIPIPLGGTTVFFRRRALEEMGGWDAHNVTEDADLGMRLARFGYRCEMIRSVTLEEANCRPWRWIRQRSRWLKGYAITWSTHMRSPRRLFRDLGWRGFAGFQVLFLGGMTSYLAMPMFWALALTAAYAEVDLLAGLPPSLLWGFGLSMLTGKVIMLSVGAVALWDSGRLRMTPWLFCLPFYWPLGAVAAYWALIEVFVKPFHWNKTEHGLARTFDPMAGQAAAS